MHVILKSDDWFNCTFVFAQKGKDLRKFCLKVRIKIGERLVIILQFLNQILMIKNAAVFFQLNLNHLGIQIGNLFNCVSFADDGKSKVQDGNINENKLNFKESFYFKSRAGSLLFIHDCQYTTNRNFIFGKFS